MTRKKTRGKRKRGGSMSGMRSGFKGLLGSKKSKKSDPKQFMYILGFLFIVGVLFFAMSGQ